MPDPEEEFEEVIRMARIPPESGLADFSLVRGVGLNCFIWRSARLRRRSMLRR